MTHVPANISEVNQQLSTVLSSKGKAYRVTSVKDNKVKAINLMFSFQLNLVVGYPDREKFTQLIGQTWTATNKGIMCILVN